MARQEEQKLPTESSENLPVKKEISGLGIYMAGVALSLIAAGMGTALKYLGIIPVFNPFFKGWWTIQLMLPFVANFIKKGPTKVNLYFIAFSAFLLITRQYGVKPMLTLAFPYLITSLGVVIISKSKIFNSRRITDSATGNRIGIPIYRSVMTRRDIKATAKESASAAQVRAFMAPLKVDLTDFRFEKESVIDVETVFSTAEIKLPRDINVLIKHDFGITKIVNETVNTYVEGRPNVYFRCRTGFGRITLKN